MLLQPKLNTLPDPQRELWPQLKDVPQQYVLYGGTAIALRYGHRESIDFDFFSTDQSDISPLTKELPFIINNPPSQKFLDLNDGESRHVFNHSNLCDHICVHFIDDAITRAEFFDKSLSTINQKEPFHFRLVKPYTHLHKQYRYMY